MRLKDAFRRDWPVWLFYLLLVVIINVKILFSSGVINHADISFPSFPEVYRDLTFHLFSDYGSVTNLENFNRTFINSIFSLLANGLHSALVVPRLIFFGFNIFSLLAFHYSVRDICGRLFNRWPKRWPLAMGAVLFTFSPWIILHNQAIFFWLAYILIPVVIWTTTSFVDRPTWPKTWLLALLLTLIGATPQFLFLASCLVLIWCLTLMWSRRQYSSRALFQLTVGTGLAYVLLNLNYLLPCLWMLWHGQTISPGYELTKDMYYTFGQNFSVGTILRGTQYWNSGIFDGVYPAISNGSVIVGAVRYLLVALSLSILFIRRRSRYWILAVVPLTVLLPALFYNQFVAVVYRLPVISWFFRDPSKLVYPFWFFIAVMLVLAVDHLWERRTAGWRGWLLPASIWLLLLLSAFDRTLIYYGNHFVPSPMGDSYDAANVFLAQQKPGKIMLMAPYGYGMSKNQFQFETSYTWNEDRVASHIQHNVVAPNIGYYHLTTRSWQPIIYQRVYPEFSAADPNTSLPGNIGRTYLAPANIRYVLFHNDIVGAQGLGAQAVIFLQEHSDLRLIGNWGDLYVFENPFARGEAFGDGIDVTSVQKLNPTKYEVTWQAAKNGHLHFAQSYDPSWKLIVGGKTLSARQDENRLTVFDVDFTASDSEELHGTIIYAPQRPYEIGLAVSLPLTYLLTLYWAAVAYARAFDKAR